jgi:hypothetical protein
MRNDLHLPAAVSGAVIDEGAIQTRGGCEAITLAWRAARRSSCRQHPVVYPARIPPDAPRKRWFRRAER